MRNETNTASQSEPHPLERNGERLLPGDVTRNMPEHLHRYAIAAELCCGKTVLDIASGEGYGSALLAAVATSVVGVDISEDAIHHATATYRLPNLRYVVGSATSIPMDSESVDVVVSFETLEHLSDHETMLCEFKRVLKPNGVAIVSTPDKKYYTDARMAKNPHHVRELYEDAFRALMDRHFARTHFLRQRAICGSIVVPDERIDNFWFYWGDFRNIAGVRGNHEALFLIGIASDGDLPGISASAFDASGSLVMEDPHLRHAYHSIKASRSYRLGRAITWPVRALLGRP
jgi:O-antigen biosynthesis protein